MSLSDPILNGPHAGRTVDDGHGSCAELKIAGEHSGGGWAVVEWRSRRRRAADAHAHARGRDLYLLEDAITADVGGEKIEVEAVQDLARRAQVPVPQLYLAERVAGV